jgi:hypothetical protein
MATNSASPLADVLPNALESGAFTLIDSSDAIAAMRKAPREITMLSLARGPRGG